jgi:hypothetical protein
LGRNDDHVEQQTGARRTGRLDRGGDRQRLGRRHSAACKLRREWHVLLRDHVDEHEQRDLLEPRGCECAPARPHHRNAGADGHPDLPTDADACTEPDAVAKSDTEPDPISDTKPHAHSHAQSDTESDADAKSDTEPDPISNTKPYAQPECLTESEPEPNGIAIAQSDPDRSTDTDPDRSARTYPDRSTDTDPDRSAHTYPPADTVTHVDADTSATTDDRGLHLPAVVGFLRRHLPGHVDRLADDLVMGLRRRIATGYDVSPGARIRCAGHLRRRVDRR